MGDSLAERLKQVFASPTFLGSPLLTVLDELQVALGASRLDATIVEPEKDPYLISSALARERDADHRDWKGKDDQPASHYDGVQWWWEYPEGNGPARTKVRTALSASNRRLRLTFEKHPRPFQENGATLTEMTLWFAQSPGGAAVQDIISAANTSLETGANTRPKADPFKEITDPFNGLRDSDSRTFLADAFELFDKWLKGLLRAHRDEKMIDYDFLNQFFWVTRAPNPAAPADLALAQVMPVFLKGQRKRLLEERKKLASRPETSAESDVEWISNYQLDSCSLFSAFPADTGLSLYVEDWPSEPLPTDLSEERRQLFGELTKNAHESAAKEVGLGENDKLNLFSVPVLVGRQPLFVTTMSLPLILDPEKRTRLAGHIRALGGIMHLQAKLYDLASQNKRQQELERELERARSKMSEHALVTDLINKTVGGLPSKTLSLLRNAHAEARRTKIDKCQLDLEDVENVIEGCDEVVRKANELSRQFTIGEDHAIDLAEALKSAIGAIPKSLLSKPDFDHDPPIHWWVKGCREMLVSALVEIIITATEVCSDGQVLKIRLREEYEEFYVRLEFLDNRAAQGREPFRGLALKHERFNRAHLSLQEMGGVEFDKPIIESNGDKLYSACCVVRLPLIMGREPAS